MKKIYGLLALICSVLTFFAVGNVFYSNGSLRSAAAALLCIMGVALFKRLSKG